MKDNGLSCVAEHINITLVQDIISHILFSVEDKDMAKSQHETLQENTIWSIAPYNCLYAKYQFQYLGELLERYEERFGTDIKDIRAIVFALAQTASLYNDSMFIGTQKFDFLQKVKKTASEKDDFFCKLALNTLAGQDNLPYPDILKQKYRDISKLVFLLMCCSNLTQGILEHRDEIYDALGSSRSFAVAGNERIYIWFGLTAQKALDKQRGKDISFFRAISKLLSENCKDGSGPYHQLIKHGYTQEEISYLNYILSYHGPFILPETLKAEKIACNFLLTHINSEKTHCDAVYEQVKLCLDRYRSLSVKINGKKSAYQAIRPEIDIQNPDTYIFLSKNIFSDSKVFTFDILDCKWDKLYGSVDNRYYLAAFDLQVNSEKEKEVLDKRLAKYYKLTGNDYLDSFQQFDYMRNEVFRKMVQLGYINLIEVFQDNDNEKQKDCPEIFCYFEKFLMYIDTLQAFEFIKYLIDNKGFRKAVIFLSSRSKCAIETGLISNLDNIRQPIPAKIKISREFLTLAQQKEMFSWLEQYIFENKVEYYLSFIASALKDNIVEKLVPFSERRTWFDLLPTETQNSLKEIYLTKDELAYQDRLIQEEAQKEALRKMEEERKEAEELLLHKYYNSYSDIFDFLDLRFRSKDRKLHNFVVKQLLEEIIKRLGTDLNLKEVIAFFKVCQELFQYSQITLKELQEYISKLNIQEEMNYDECA